MTRCIRSGARSGLVACFASVALLFALSASAQDPIAVVDGLQGTHSCRVLEQQCVDQTATKTIQGYAVSVDEVGGCWQYQSRYECSTADFVDDCGALRQTCEQIGSRCVSADADGACNQHEQTYRCEEQPGGRHKTTVCVGRQFCQGGLGCFDTGYAPDGDFGHAIAMTEAARQAGMYFDVDKLEVFKGDADECSIKVLGGSKIKSCCASSGGGSGFTNHAMLAGALSVGSGLGKEAARVGSKYVYDSLYSVSNPELLNRGLSAMNSWAVNTPAFSPTLSFYGFEFGFSMTNGFQMVSFDPYSFAAQIAIKVIQTWLQCSSSEQVMSLKRGQNLCVHVDTRCKTKVLGVCVERAQKHCCFNSKLNKIINRQGRAQLGLALDVCDGLTAADLQRIDFAQIDMSEFIADIIPKDTDLEGLVGDVGKTVQDYYNR